MFGFIEIYIGMDYMRFVHIQEILRKNNIKYKVKINTARNRLLNNRLGGGTPFILNDGGMKAMDQYIVKVKKEDAQKVKYLINNE